MGGGSYRAYMVYGKPSMLLCANFKSELKWPQIESSWITSV